jgi:hypothetical protein
MDIITSSQFFGKLFQSRDTSHLIHLRTKSFAIHKALNKYYDEILELTDTLIESYQGNNQIVNIKIDSSIATDPIVHLNDLKAYIEKNRDIFKESYLQNIIDTIMQLINQTLYRLINLK